MFRRFASFSALSDMSNTSTISDNLSDILISLIVPVFALYIGLKIAEKLLFRYIRKNRHKSKMSEAKFNTVTKLLDGAFKFTMFFVIIMEMLIAFGVDATQILAITSTFTVALGFAAQGIIKDFINGIVLVVEDQYRLGDLVEINNFKGTVEKLTMRVTQLRDIDGSLHIIPNSRIGTVTTFSKDFVKAIVIVGVEYSADISKVIQKLETEMANAYADMSDKMLGVPEVLGISAFTDSSIDIKIVCNTKVGEKYTTEYALRLRIKKMFDKEGICIPFPQRDVHIVSNANNTM